MRLLAIATIVAVVGALLADFFLALLVSVNVRVMPSIPWFAVLLFIALTGFAVWLASQASADRPRFNQFPIWSVCASAALGVMCLVAVQGAILSILQGAYSVSAVGEPNLVTAFLAVPAYSAVVEELLFRGVVQPRVQRAVGGYWAVAITTIIFVLIHIGRPDFEFQWPLFLAIGIVCGWVSFRGSLLAAILIHGIYNVGVNAFLHSRGAFNFSTGDDARTFVLLLGALITGAAVIIVGVLGSRNSSGSNAIPEGSQ